MASWRLQISIWDTPSLHILEAQATLVGQTGLFFRGSGFRSLLLGGCWIVGRRVARRGLTVGPNHPVANTNLIARWDVRQRVNEAQLAVLDPKDVGIGQAAHAEIAKGDNGADHLVDDEAPRDDVDASRHADRAGIVRRTFAGAQTSFGSFARVTPRHEISLLLQESIEVGVGRRDQGVAAIALSLRNHSPIL